MRWCCYVHPLHFVHNQKSFPNRDHQTAAANQTQTVPSSQIDALSFQPRPTPSMWANSAASSTALAVNSQLQLQFETAEQI